MRIYVFCNSAINLKKTQTYFPLLGIIKLIYHICWISMRAYMVGTR